MGAIEDRLSELGLALPRPFAPPPGVKFAFELVRVCAGLAYVSVSDKAWAKIEKNTAARTFYLDLRRYKAKLAENDTPFTPANTLVKAQRVSLKKLRAEGIQPEVPWLYGYKLDFRFR